MDSSTRAIVRGSGVAGLLVALLLIPAAGASGTTLTKVKVDTYLAAGYERQVDGRTCTAASTAMMENFIARSDLGLRQLSIPAYEQSHDALNDKIQRGSDPLGWASAATHYSVNAGDATTYRWVAYPSKMAALNAAAKAIAKLHKPVGVAVWNGGHAIVMTGFGASADPNKGAFLLTAVITSDPYTSGQTVGQHRTWAPDAFPFGKYLQLDATPSYDAAWYGKWIVIVPID